MIHFSGKDHNIIWPFSCVNINNLHIFVCLDYYILMVSYARQLDKETWGLSNEQIAYGLAFGESMSNAAFTKLFGPVGVSLRGRLGGSALSGVSGIAIANDEDDSPQKSPLKSYMNAIMRDIHGGGFLIWLKGLLNTPEKIEKLANELDIMAAKAIEKLGLSKDQIDHIDACLEKDFKIEALQKAISRDAQGNPVINGGSIREALMEENPDMFDVKDEHALDYYDIAAQRAFDRYIRPELEVPPPAPVFAAPAFTR